MGYWVIREYSNSHNRVKRGKQMIKINDFQKNYINHYLLLEKDFEETKPYLTIAEDNYEAYSNTYMKLLLAIGSEIDVMLEVVAKEYDPNSNEEGFGYSKIILKHEPNIKSTEILLRDEGITVRPWECKTIPTWWTIYNEVKHNRNKTDRTTKPPKKYYQLANQKNVLYALAALYSLEMYGYRIIATNSGEKMFVPAIKSMFSIRNLYWADIIMGNGVVVIDGNMYMA